MTTMTAGVPAGFDIGQVVQRTFFGGFGPNFKLLAPLALIFGALPAFLVGVLDIVLPGAQNAGASMTIFKFVFGITVLTFDITFWIIGYSSIVYGAVNKFTGKSTTITDCVREGRRRFWVVFRVFVLDILGTLAGLCLFVIPGTIFRIMWSASSQVAIIEGFGARASIGRSMALTKGKRWQIFGMQIIIGIVSLIFLTVVGAIFVAPLSLSYRDGGMGPQSPTVLIMSLVFSPLFQMAVMLIGSVGAAALYVELGGGRTTEAVADVFT